MNYYALFYLTREPFANSPDPDLFYYSAQQHDCLQKIELALRLRRGLSVVIGPVGTGKSTLCRALLQSVTDGSGAVEAHLILDPDFTSSREFLTTIIKTFGIENECSSEWQMKEAIKNFLIHQGVDRDRIPVLIIDEGQKLPGFCIEILREFLNFETNQSKLLEIVIFAQKEFTEMLKSRPNFSDRITSYHTLGPLSFAETRHMIRYRIQQCRLDGKVDPELFPLPSLLLIFLLTKGYPRKIVMLCSKILLAMLVKEKTKATLSLVWSSAKETSIINQSIFRKSIYGSGGLVLLVCGVFLLSGNAGLVENVKSWFQPEQSAQQQTGKQAGFASKEQKIRDAALPAVAAAPSSQTSGGVIQEQSPEADTKNNLKTIVATQPPPEELGHLTVTKGMSLSRMVTRVYGQFSEHTIRMVLKANPYLTDPARLKVQSKIFFPRLDDSATSKFTPVLVSLGTFPNLQSAYDFLISALGTGEAMRILPMWDGGSQLFFQVVLKENFSDEKQARQALGRLGGRFRAAAMIMSDLDGIPL